MTAWVIVKREELQGIDPYYPREEWHAYDPFLISEGLFGAGMISRFDSKLSSDLITNQRQHNLRQDLYASDSAY